jgi:hypothetical protein
MNDPLANLVFGTSNLPNSGDVNLSHNGRIDDIGIWNRALIPEEVQELYTLDACTFTMYDTLTVENVINVYDTLTIENIVQVFDTTIVVEMLYDTTYTNIELFDTITVENIVNVYDTTTIFETAYDTTYTNIELFDTITVENIIEVFDTTIVVETLYDTAYTNIEVFDTTTIVETEVVYDTIMVEDIVHVFDTTIVVETLYDTAYTHIEVFDTTNIVETEVVYDTITTENIVNVYDTSYITVTDTLLIDITFTGFEGQPSWLNTVIVYPNPANDHITIDYGNFALMAGYNTIITNAAGATVYSSAVNAQQVEIDINAWGSAGVYYMSIYDANGALAAVRHIVLE